MAVEVTHRPTLLVLASTYPRWHGDPEPGFVHELSKRLTDDFHVIVLGPHAPGSMPHETMDGVEVIRYRYAPQRWETLVNDGGIVTNLRRNIWKFLLVPGFVLAQAWQAWRLIQKRGVRVVHAHWIMPQGLICALLQRLPGRKVPYVVTSHGADLFALKGAVLDALKRLVVRRSAATTVVSNAMRQELEKIGAEIAKVSVQSMGVDLEERFTPDPRLERSCDEILFVGRLVEKKGLRHLINAMPAILFAHQTAHLTVVGFGPEEAALRAQLEILGLQNKVKLEGAVTQALLPSYYRRATVFVVPFVQAVGGDREGLGLVVVEAIGCGCPVIAGDVPAVRDLPVEVVDPSNKDELANAILRVLGDPASAKQLANEQRTQCAATYDWRSVSIGYGRLLSRVLSNNSGFNSHS